MRVVDADVIIAGAGPAGLMLAGELGLAGVRPLVLERYPQPRDTEKATGLGGQILELLRYRGLLERFRAASPDPDPAPRFPFGGLHVEGMYGFGGVPGSTGQNSMYGFAASYALGPLEAVAGFQQNDVSGKKFNIVNVGAVYTFTPTLKVLAGWLHSQDNTGLADIDEQQSGAPTLAHVSPNRIDDSFYVGSTWQVTAPLALTVAGYYDHARNAALLDGSLGNGINYSATVLAEYSLSKRTEVYGTVDFTRGNGAFLADYPGRNNQTGVAIGLRNIF